MKWNANSIDKARDLAEQCRARGLGQNDSLFMTMAELLEELLKSAPCQHENLRDLDMETQVCTDCGIWGVLRLREPTAGRAFFTIEKDDDRD